MSLTKFKITVNFFNWETTIYNKVPRIKKSMNCQNNNYERKKKRFCLSLSAPLPCSLKNNLKKLKKQNWENSVIYIDVYNM